MKRKKKTLPRRRPVHDNIRRLRTDLDLTQEQLGEQLGTDKTVISHWENAKSSPRTDLLPRVAAALGVTVDELLAAQGQAA